MDLDLYNDTYNIFCQLLEKQHSSILEVGCGPGNITRHLLSNRPDFKILAIDVAPKMIELAKQNNPLADFIVMDCRKINTIKRKFDGIVCGFCIPYLSKDDCSEFLKGSFDRLEHKGIIYLSALEGDYSQSKFETVPTGDKSYVYYYDETYLKNELSKNNFILLHSIVKLYPNGNGSNQKHLILIAQKK